MRNRYLEDRARGRKDMARGRGMRDMRNPYGPRGGYLRDSRGNDYGMDHRYDYTESDYRYDYRGGSDYRGQDYDMGNKYNREHTRNDMYEMYGTGMIHPMRQDERRDYRDYGDYRDYADYGDYDYAEEDKEYKKHLKKWTEKLKEKDRMHISESKVIEQAKNMKIPFEDFNEEEFYAIYLMHVSDYPEKSNDYNYYISMAYDWLKDDDVYYKGGEKVCSYLYHTVLGK